MKILKHFTKCLKKRKRKKRKEKEKKPCKSNQKLCSDVNQKPLINIHRCIYVYVNEFVFCLNIFGKEKRKIKVLGTESLVSNYSELQWLSFVWKFNFKWVITMNIACFHINFKYIAFLKL